MTTAVRNVTYGKEVYEAWVYKRSEKGRNYSKETVFFEGDTIYSYGYHFPMAKRFKKDNGYDWYLVNGDSYSTTTATHQSHLRSALQGKDMVVIPFSALEEAGINMSSIEYLDMEDEKYVTKRVRNREGEWEDRKYHLLGSVFFKATRTYQKQLDTYREDYYGRKVRDTEWVNDEPGYFLAGLDETGRDPWRSFFLAQIDEEKLEQLIGLWTVEDAYSALKPEEVLVAEMDNREVLRQGEWFFVKVCPEVEDELKMLEKQGQVLAKHLIPNRDPEREARHLVTRYVEHYGVKYARGTVRHTGQEHAMLKLDGWYEVYENTQVSGWSGSGRID